ncbi:MAG: UDP-2,4-diacetamido-2,4,6-trideoxy-beta-L-altropyranose hydrolase [Lachnospiraceae bacterium]|nr:UDP-2,4-diacetamido-2,4,6-trideoxy-beta-L-altropyranose hydrolase [Lachnospiraceae bacterium]
MIYVRADGNGKIGMGHIMRCIAISEEVAALGEPVTFILAGEEAREVVEAAGFEVLVLGTDYTRMDAEWSALEQVLPQGATVLVDSYYVTEDYLRDLEERGTVLYMDDKNEFPHPVTGVINGNIYGSDMDYRTPLVMAGCDYAPLRREYREARGTGRPEYLLITTGSSDPYSITWKTLIEMGKRPLLKGFPMKVVCGRFNRDYEQIRALEQQYPRMQVLQNVPDMWNLMKDAQVAVTAGGTTMNELSCMGVPAVCFSFVDNQEQITRVSKEKGYVHFSGDYLREGDAMIPRMCDAVEELLGDNELQQNYRAKAYALVDGLGSKRIAEALIRLVQE